MEIYLADQLGNADGCILMSPAANLVKQHAPEELDRLGDMFGCKTLKRYMLATQMFETLDESMPKGEMSTLYRLISTIE